ncbi:MAG: hypothetical protein IK133_02635 [Clostridia bacterium]|nr:hypothetical protein [Clostridia bacterium]
MKCPQCGRWNRATQTKCFYCGIALDQNDQASASLQPSDQPQPSSSVIYSVNQDGMTSTPQPDVKDRLAKEMQSFHVRRQHGEERQRRILRENAERGVTATGTLSGTRTTQLYEEPRADESVNSVPEGVTRPGARPARRAYELPDINNDQNEFEGSDSPVLFADPQPEPAPSYAVKPRKLRHTRTFGLRVFLPYLALLLAICGLVAAGWLIIFRPIMNKREAPEEAKVEITATIQDDMVAHRIRIPADDGSQIYIKELRRSYIAVGGYAEVTVPDYTWYELNSDIESPTMDVTLTPYLRTSAGEQRLMDVITYTIDIPLSPLTLVSPDTTWLEVSTSPVNIQFRVAQNSTVFINGEDFSSFVNTQDGLISYNATVLAKGDNTFNIVVNCQYYRQNAITLTIYRAPQDVPLELSQTLGDTSAQQLMTIRGTTFPGATIKILSDYEDLDTSLLNTTGEFSFKAKFSKIGTNTITIVAERNGLSTTLNKDIYYVPYSSTYTPKAWPMNAAGYLDYLNNIDVRVQRTQIYECIGTITEILSSKPQLALMNTGTEDSERLVLLENMSTDTWEVGKRYRVYADAYGIYDGKPRLVARYTYPPRD